MVLTKKFFSGNEYFFILSEKLDFFSGNPKKSIFLWAPPLNTDEPIIGQKKSYLYCGKIHKHGGGGGFIKYKDNWYYFSNVYNIKYFILTWFISWYSIWDDHYSCYILNKFFTENSSKLFYYKINPLSWLVCFKFIANFD